MELYDIIIIGGGPAALTAGLYASRGGMKALLVESLSVVAQLAMTEMVENYPGIKRISGFDLLTAFKNQAKDFAMESHEGTVNAISQIKENDKRVWQVESENGIFKALSVIIATGASPKRLNIPGEKEFLGKGVSYCATCDAAFFRNKRIVVVGGGDTAVEEALFLTKFAEKVILVHRKARLRAVKVIQERAFSNKKMEFVWESVAEEISGNEKVEKIKIKNIQTNQTMEIPCDGVFVFVGWEPNTGFIREIVNLDKNRGIIVDADMKTSQEGIFAAGDCCSKLLHQIVTACGDGAVAGYSAQRYVEELKGTAYR